MKKSSYQRKDTKLIKKLKNKYKSKENKKKFNNKSKIFQGLYFVINHNIVRSKDILPYQYEEYVPWYQIDSFHLLLEIDNYGLFHSKLTYIPINYEEYDLKYASNLLPNDNHQLSDEVYEKLKAITYYKPKEPLPINFMNHFNNELYQKLIENNQFSIFFCIYNYIINTKHLMAELEFFNHYINEYTLNYVVAYCDLNFIIFLIKKSYELNLSNGHYFYWSNADNIMEDRTLLDCAYANGRWDVINFIKDTLKFKRVTIKAMDFAAANGHLDVVEYLYFNRNEGCTQYAIDQAAINNHVDVVRFLYLHKNRHVSSKIKLRAKSERTETDVFINRRMI